MWLPSWWPRDPWISHHAWITAPRAKLFVRLCKYEPVVEDVHTPFSQGNKGLSGTSVKTRGNRDSPKGRTLYWYAQPSNANRMNGLCSGRIETWIASNQSRGFCINILKGSMWSAQFKACRSKIGRKPTAFLGHNKVKCCKTLTSYQLEGLALSHPSPAGLRFPHARQGHRRP